MRCLLEALQKLVMWLSVGCGALPRLGRAVKQAQWCRAGSELMDDRLGLLRPDLGETVCHRMSRKQLRRRPMQRLSVWLGLASRWPSFTDQAS